LVTLRVVGRDRLLHAIELSDNYAFRFL
jgi:hypothetical protein